MLYSYGKSVVDYVLTSPQNFVQISEFQVHDFNEFSNHAPVSLTLKIHTHPIMNNQSERLSYKWKPEHKDEFLRDVSSDVHIFNRLISEGIDRNCEPDDIVTDFLKFITDRANIYFENRSAAGRNQAFINSNYKEKQKWYGEECKKNHENYQNMLYNYNLNRNNETRKIMLATKKDYKYCCRSCKLKYSYEQGRKMNEMRRKQPKQFWKIFKRNKTSQCDEVPINEFFDYFKSFASQDSTFTAPEVSEFMQNFDGSMNNSTFCELDEPITQDEIRKASKKLNPNKACSLDTLINEYFKESIDRPVNPLETLFNYILNKGTFPNQWSKWVIIPIYKTGDNREPSDYRGITLVNCF